MNNGWICLHRQLLDNPRAKDPEWMAVWIYLLLNATHQPMKAVFSGKVVTLQPGQLITGRYAIAENTGVHPSKVQRILQTLKIDQQIDQQSGSKSSIITVLKWEQYQKVDQQNDQQSISKRSASDQQAITNNNITTEQLNKITPFNPPEGELPGLSRESMAKELIEFLNAEAGRKFTESKEATAGAIRLLKETDDDLDGLKKMIERQCLIWEGTKMAEYLQPSTLFAKTKWRERYEKRNDPIICEEPKSSPVPPHVQLRAIDELIANHPANHESPRYSGNPTSEQREEFRKLHYDRKEIINKIATQK